jgi:hypothetical protein
MGVQLMTVSELIAQLQQYDANAHIFLISSNTGADTLYCFEITGTDNDAPIHHDDEEPIGYSVAIKFNVSQTGARIR